MRGVAIYAAFFAAALALFLLLPQLDLWVSGLFYARGRGFVLESWPPVILVYRAVPWVAWGIVSGYRRGCDLALSCRPAAVAVRPEGAAVHRFLDCAGSGTSRQHRAEGSLGARPPGADRGVRRVPPFHPGPVAGSRMCAQLLLCFGSRRARLFPRRFCLPVAAGAPAPSRYWRGIGFWRSGRARPHRPGRPLSVGCRLCRPAGLRHNGAALLVDR